MAYTFPLPLADFFAGLPIQTAVPDLTEAVEMSQSGGGEILTADVGPRLWKMDVSIRPGYYADIEPIKAKLNLLRRAGRSLIVHAIPSMYPAADPTGSILGANVVQLDGVNVNHRDISLSGFPPGYKISVGDCMSFTYGSNPVRFAMHQFVGEAYANGEGVISPIEVIDFIRPGFTLGAPVTIIKPAFKAIVVPGSTNPGRVGQRMIDGLQFTVMQTLR